MARTYLELQTEVLDHGFSPNRYRARVKRWLNDALGKVARRVNLPTEDVTSPISAVAGTSSYALPSDLVRIDSLRVARSPRDIILTPEDRQTLDTLDQVRGLPTRYALDGQNVVLWPIPDAAYTVNLRYQRVPGQLVDDTNVSPLANEYDDLLICYALWRAYRSEDDAEMARDYERQWRDGLLEIGGDLHGRDPNHVRQVAGMLDVWGDDVPSEPDVTF